MYKQTDRGEELDFPNISTARTLHAGIVLYGRDHEIPLPLYRGGSLKMQGQFFPKF